MSEKVKTLLGYFGLVCHTGQLQTFFFAVVEGAPMLNFKEQKNGFMVIHSFC